VAALTECLAGEPDPVVRAHAAWGLGAIGTTEALEVLRARVSREHDESVLRELEAALHTGTRADG
jgi:HEAT repeat protein